MHASFHLFVYGTLRSGGPASRLLDGCVRVGQGSVAGVLYDIDGEYPALVPYGTTRIPGEVWRCPAELLTELDEYEGVPHGLFRRVGVHVRMDDGDEVGCWVYVAGPGLSRKLVPAARVSS